MTNTRITTIHELAHTAHVSTMNNAIDYAGVISQIQESWCVAVEWYITGMEYKERGILNYGDWNYSPANIPVYPHHYAYQHWDIGLDPDYTTLFINVIDDFNELGIWFANEIKTGVVNDNVSGYNLGVIQNNYLKHIYSLSSLSTQLKANKAAGVTNAQIDQLLSFY